MVTLLYTGFKKNPPFIIKNRKSSLSGIL